MLRPYSFLVERAACCRLRRLPMAEKKANSFRQCAGQATAIETRSLARLCGRRRSWRRIFSFIFTTLGGGASCGPRSWHPYAVTFYVTHKCNLACSYCTQKEPDVFSESCDERDDPVVEAHTKETDSIVITGANRRCGPILRIG